MKFLNRFTRVAAAALLFALPFLATESQAMPSFARQTGMVCTSCHIGTDSVPNFTRTGRIFAMRGYTRPVVREKLRVDGQEEGEPQYGGQYLSLNWTDFFAARLITSLASQSTTNGVKSDVKSQSTSRMAFFYTGPITDWLGLWTEIGYLGNNSLNSVTTGNAGAPSQLNFYAFDEFRLSSSRSIGPNSFIGFSFGNEPGDVVTQFVFPTGMSRYFSLGQGGTGKELNIETISLHAFLDDRLWLQFAPTTGVSNNSWSNGWDQYFAVAYNMFRKTDNDLWLGLEYERGNDTVSILTPYKTSFICPGTCPSGISDASLSFSNTLGGRAVAGAPVEKVKKFYAYAARAEWDVADRGPHSYVAMIQATGTSQDYESGAHAKRNGAGLYLRYFYNRTYGFQASWYHDFKYEYTDALGRSQEFGKANSKNLVALWNPAMNVSVHLSYNPNSTSAVFRDPVTGIAPKANTSSSWDLGLEYSF
jgi:hypothetical protein